VTELPGGDGEAPPEDEGDLDVALDLIADGRIDPGIALLRGVLAVRPDEVRALYGLGAALAHRGDLAGAVECYGRVCDLIPDAAEPLDAYATALGAAGRLADAVAACARIAELPGFEGAAALRRARLHLAAGDAAAALAAFREAYGLELGRPRRRTISFEHARALARRGHHGEARELLDRALADGESESEEQDEELRALRAECAAALGRS
jgi:tetratricopeptide (TPR) repeat protein